MIEILLKFIRFSGKENGDKFKLSIVLGVIEALAAAMKIPAIMYILIGLLNKEPMEKYIYGSLLIMVISILIGVFCKKYSTVLQTKGGYSLPAGKTVKFKFLGTGMISVMPVPLLAAHPRECSPQGRTRYVPSACACRWTCQVHLHRPP